MILITGATGFLGSNLALKLVEEGEKISAIRRSGSVIPTILRPFASLIEWREADILDLFVLEQAFENIDYVYHCAAMVSFEPDDRKQMIRTNTEGTANIVELCARFQVKKLLHVSSVAAIGIPIQCQMASEMNILELNSSSSGYSISKFESEREVWRAIVEGLNAVIVNPSLILGETNLSNGSGRMFGLVNRGFGLYPPGLTGMISVQNVITCMVGLMKSSVSGERFILSAENFSFKDFFQQAAAHLGRPIPVKEIKPWILSLAGNLSFLFKNLGLNKESANLAMNKTFFDTSKINKLDICKFTPIKEVIEEICGEINLASIPTFGNSE